MKRRIVSLVMAIVLAGTLMTGCVKVVKIGEEGSLTGDVEFNPGDSVESIWESAVVPECEKKAVNISEVLDEAGNDLKTLGDKCGGVKTESASNYNYCVKVENAKITEVDKKSFYGKMTLEIPDYNGKITVICEIGKYKSTAVRDDMSFLDFGDFTNQTEWGQINLSMQKKIDEAVVKPVYDSIKEGATVNLIGCFTADSSDKVLISPVVLEVK